MSEPPKPARPGAAPAALPETWKDLVAARRHHLEAFERALQRAEPADFERNLGIYEALYREAEAAGVLPPADPLEGIDIKIELARRLHVRGGP